MTQASGWFPLLIALRCMCQERETPSVLRTPRTSPYIRGEEKAILASVWTIPQMQQAMGNHRVSSNREFTDPSLCMGRLKLKPCVSASGTPGITRAKTLTGTGGL